MNDLENTFAILSIVFLFICVPTVCLCRCSGEKNKIINIPVSTIPSSKIPLLTVPLLTEPVNRNNKYVEI
jgi:hypothetical protein